MNRTEILAKHQEFLFPSVATFYAEPLPLTRGEGQFIWDVDGNRYLDFFGGAGALNGGQQIELPERTTVSNLHLTVLNKAGLEMESFGDSTGEIAGV